MSEVMQEDPGLSRWRSAVADVLARSARRDPAELPDQPERLLDSPSYEGFDIHALYTAPDAPPEAPLPGQWPFVRGGDAHRDVLSGWKVAEEFPSAGFAGSVTDANTAILAALVDGVSALIVRVGDGGVEPGSLAALLDGVYLDLAPVILMAGADFGPAADAMLSLLGRSATSGGLSIDLGADPLVARWAGRPAPPVADTLEVATRISGPPGVRVFTVDGAAFHDGGANASWELAGSVAAATEYLRLLTAAGVGVADALSKISFRLAADDDQFMTIAKFRAARRLWARVGEVLDEPGSAAARLHAVTSVPMMTQRDPWVNMVRTTLAAFGAGVGGADTVSVAAFDSAIPGGLAGYPPEFSRRIARNSQLLLLEESHIGRVLDPAGGSWYVESLTETLADRAWSNFQQIEARGGFRSAGDFLAEQIEQIRTRRDRDIAHRRTAITGVTEFPDLEEPMLPDTTPSGGYRYAERFEALRDRSDAFLRRTGGRPRVLLLPLGPPAENNSRSAFTANLLAAGGIDVLDPGPVDPTGIGKLARQAGAEVAVVCGTDRRYQTELAAAVAAARDGGCGSVYLAGPDTVVPDLPAGHRPDGHLAAGIDAVEVLSALLTRLGA